LEFVSCVIMIRHAINICIVLLVSWKYAVTYFRTKSDFFTANRVMLLDVIGHWLQLMAHFKIWYGLVLY